MAALSLSVFFIQAILLLSVTVSTASTAPRGFIADLIRHDTPKFPFYNPKRASACKRSRLRLAYVTQGSPFSDVIADTAWYHMKIQVGTPPFEIAGVLDTGSDLVWTQCQPCLSCFTQDAPVFNPASSSTYRGVTCGSSQCQNVYRVHCSNKNIPCAYYANYGAGQSYSIGSIGTDTVTLHSTSGEPFVVPEITFGCGHNSTGFSTHTSGIIGLGWGQSSLISQLGDSVQGLFSHCFGGKTGKVNFGANAVVAGDGTVSTALFRKGPRSSSYFLNLEAVSVGDTRVETLGTSMQSTDGNIIIDSGTTATMLPRDYYLRVKEAVVSAVRAEMVDSGDSLCYSSSDLEDFPVITMHFTGADLVLGRSNTYIGTAPGVTCLAIVGAVDGLPSIYGNLAQYNFLVGYDVRSEIVSFKPTNCAAL